MKNALTKYLDFSLQPVRLIEFSGLSEEELDKGALILEDLKIQVEAYIASLSLSLKNANEELRLIPTSIYEDVAHRLDAGCPRCSVVARSLLWLSICTFLTEHAQRLCIERKADLFMKESGLDEFVNELRRMRDIHRKTDEGRNSSGLN